MKALSLAAAVLVSTLSLSALAKPLAPGFADKIQPIHQRWPSGLKTPYWFRRDGYGKQSCGPAILTATIRGAMKELGIERRFTDFELMAHVYREIGEILGRDFKFGQLPPPDALDEVLSRAGFHVEARSPGFGRQWLTTRAAAGIPVFFSGALKHLPFHEFAQGGSHYAQVVGLASKPNRFRLWDPLQPPVAWPIYEISASQLKRFIDKRAEMRLPDRYAQYGGPGTMRAVRLTESTRQTLMRWLPSARQVRELRRRPGYRAEDVDPLP